MSPNQATQSTQGNAGSDPEREIHLKEWEKARDFLKLFDEKLHDLRKFGFGFVTALIAANGILFSAKEESGASAEIKFAVFLVTLILIMALQLIDRNYIVFQKAAATRALVLERKLNIELSEIITDRYRSRNIEIFVWAIYGIFMFCVLLLCYYSIGAQFSLILLLIIVVYEITRQFLKLNVDYRYTVPEDWTISPINCSMDGEVKITVSNLGNYDYELTLINLIREFFRGRAKNPTSIRFKKNDLVWRITPEDTDDNVIIKKAVNDMQISDSRTWIVKGKEFGKAGVYKLHPVNYKVPLYRRIIISDEQKDKARRKKRDRKK